jgi:superfamily II DNA or RNA helicase
MLRDYQNKAIKAFENSKSKNLMISMPTGSGKTFTFTEIPKKNKLSKYLKTIQILVKEN